MTNVVNFPKSPLKGPEKIEELRSSILDYRMSKVDECADELYEDLFIKMHLFGFDVSDEGMKKDVALVVESIRSLLCKTYNVKHVLQDLAQTVMVQIDDVDNN